MRFAPVDGNVLVDRGEVPCWEVVIVGDLRAICVDIGPGTGNED